VVNLTPPNHGRLAGKPVPQPTRWPSLLPWLSLLALSLLPGVASASMFKGETLDSVAMGLAWFIIAVMPVAGIVVFWKVHILPEKIAEKRHHPQKDAIQTLCLLSLVFGGLLWPIAWLWAYTKPVSYRLAYGTDKGDEYFVEMADEAQAGKLSAGDMKFVRDELDSIASKGAMPLELHHAREKIEAALVAATARASAARAVEPAAKGAA